MSPNCFQHSWQHLIAWRRVHSTTRNATVHTPRLQSRRCHRCAINDFALSVDGAALLHDCRHHFIAFGRCHGGTNWYTLMADDAALSIGSAALSIGNNHADLYVAQQCWSAGANVISQLLRLSLVLSRCWRKRAIVQQRKRQRERFIAQMCWSRSTYSWLGVRRIEQLEGLEPLGRLARLEGREPVWSVSASDWSWWRLSTYWTTTHLVDRGSLQRNTSCTHSFHVTALRHWLDLMNASVCYSTGLRLRFTIMSSKQVILFSNDRTHLATTVLNNSSVVSVTFRINL